MAESKFVLTMLVVGMLLTGTINTVSKKMGYQTCSKGLDSVPDTDDNTKGCHPGERLFAKPWSGTLIMFLGEAMCMCVFGFKAWRNRSARRTQAEIEENPPVTLSSGLVCLLPAICDLCGTTISGVGLLFTPASIFQMLRGSIIIFTAIFSVLFLKRKVFGYQWLGIGITVVGITLVGLSSMMGKKSKNDHSAGEVLLGNAMIVFSQVLSASQMVIEEKFLKSRKLPPEFVVGVEGIFGTFVMLAFILPMTYYLPFKKCDAAWCQDGNGVHEDTLDTLEMLKNSVFLMLLNILYWISIAFFNFCGLSVSKKLSSVHRTLIDACRTVFVWVINIILYYATSAQFGEKWDNTSGFIQLGGFLLMVCGTLTHNKIIKLHRFFDYSEPTPGPSHVILDTQKEAPKSVTTTSTSLSIPLLEASSQDP
jgi:drug/metabolite transporter (DMT)-like permease